MSSTTGMPDGQVPQKPQPSVAPLTQIEAMESHDFAHVLVYEIGTAKNSGKPKSVERRTRASFIGFYNRNRRHSFYLVRISREQHKFTIMRRDLQSPEQRAARMQNPDLAFAAIEKVDDSKIGWRLRCSRFCGTRRGKNTDWETVWIMERDETETAEERLASRALEKRLRADEKYVE